MMFSYQIFSKNMLSDNNDNTILFDKMLFDNIMLSDSMLF
jgi:hypothetical protein